MTAVLVHDARVALAVHVRHLSLEPSALGVAALRRRVTLGVDGPQPRPR